MLFFSEGRFILDFLYEEVWIFVQDVIKYIMMTKDRPIRKKTAYRIENLICGLYNYHSVFFNTSGWQISQIPDRSPLLRNVLIRDQTQV
jgi:hypothetical protein